MGVKQPADLYQHVAQLVRCRLVAKSDRGVVPDPIASRVVLQLELGKGRVWDRHDRAVQRTDPGRAQPDVLDRPQPVAKATEIAHAHRTIRDHAHTAKEVLDRRLGRESYGKAPYPEASEQRGDIDAEVIEHAQDDQRRERHLGSAPAQGHDGRRAHLPARDQVVVNRLAPDVYQVEAEPTDGHETRALG